MATDEPIAAGTIEPEPETPPRSKRPAPTPAKKEGVVPPVVYPSAFWQEVGVQTCPACGAELRSMSKYPGVLRCPYGHHEQPV